MIVRACFGVGIVHPQHAAVPCPQPMLCKCGLAFPEGPDLQFSTWNNMISLPSRKDSPRADAAKCLFYRARKAGSEERPTNEEEEEVGSHLSAATAMVWWPDATPFPCLDPASAASKMKRLEEFISQVSSSFAFWSLVCKRLTSKRGRMVRGRQGEGREVERLHHFCYKTLAKRLPLSESRFPFP